NTLGVTSQKEFVQAVESTNFKLNQLNPPSTPSTNMMSAKEDAVTWGINTLIEKTPEYNAHNEVGVQSNQFSSSLNLVGSAFKNGYIPSQFTSDANFKADLTNYIFDGSLPSNGIGENFEAYKNVVSTLGKNLYNNRSSVVRGSYNPNRGNYEILQRKSGLDNFPDKSIIYQKSSSPLQKALQRYDNSKTKGRTHTTVIGPAQ